MREAEADSDLLLKRIRAVKMAEIRIKSLEEKFAQVCQTFLNTIAVILTDFVQIFI